MKPLLYIILGALAATRAAAQTPIVRPDLSTDTKIAPAYFGPNAFPVPEMLDGAVASTLQATVAGVYHWGDWGDKAVDAQVHLRVPLFTPRANLVLWIPIEHYRLTPEWKEHARVSDHPATSGMAVGSAFVSTDVLLMRESRVRPAMTVRAAMKTASEDDWTTARYYDCPGYYFDAAFGKSIALRPHSAAAEGGGRSHRPALESLRLGVSAGFLCWQTDNGRQNDATMYAASLKAKFRHVDIEQNLRGYSGWEGDGDRPMVAKTQISAHLAPRETASKRRRPVFSPFLSYEKGLHDYPYQHISAGLTIEFDILRKQRAD